jgi:hypothetical protein
MRRPLLAWLLLAAPAAGAQDPAPTYQKESQFKLRVDALLRQEWTNDILRADGTTENDDRWRIQVRPRIELALGKLRLGVGADMNYAKDDNVPGGEPRPALIRDNYDSRDVRLDLAFADLAPGAGFRLQAGRFRMPVDLTEMLWDRDLHAQGGAVSWATTSEGGSRFSLTALGSRGSHVFKDEVDGPFDDGTNTVLFSAELSLPSGPEGRFEATGSFLRFTDLGFLEPMIRRQNTRVAGQITQKYDVLDLVLRLRRGGAVTSQFVLDVALNTAAEDCALAGREPGSCNKGIWAAVVLGSTETAKGVLSYTYASVDKDVTLAAYGADDFFWVTGWKGHRGELAVRTSDRTTLHLIGQLQRFKDAPRPEERDHWVKRARVEIRVAY